MLKIKQKGDFKRTFSFFERSLSGEYLAILERYAKNGVAALAANTPVSTGGTASAWGYEIKVNRRSTSIYWTNDNAAGGVPIVILLQYGHGTGTGGYIEGEDFINPAIQPTFRAISEELWKEVTRV